MIENEQLPDWLVEMREQQLGEQSPGEENPRQLADQAGGVRERQDPMSRAERAREEEDMPDQPDQIEQDVLEDLREQMIQAEEELEEERKSSLIHALSGLKPAQRLMLAILLFLNVALCGCMGLVMTGRVVLPF
ncbi:MAG: hypothetical protein DRI48_01585 [Chloroflexi bacterium]|nr:MAG: hypothetical protein DRI48_01585 [Chloroflexota bacterium]